MCEIHDDQKGLAEVDAFKAAGDAFQALNAGLDGGAGNVQSRAVGGDGGEQEIVDVDSSDERRVDDDRSGGRLRGKIEAARRESELFGGNLGVLRETVGDRFGSQAGELRAVRIVAIDNAELRRAATGPLKEAALGGEVILKCPVEIEVVASQVGENGSGEAATPQAFLHQGVRTGFQNGVGPAFGHDFREETLEFERFRRGVCGGPGLERRAMEDGAEKSAVATGGGQNRIDQETSSGFAVGAGDADQLQVIGGPAVKICSNHCQRLARAGDAHPRHFGRERGRRSWTKRFPCRTRRRRQLAHDDAGPAIDGVGDEAISISRFPADGHKQRAGRGFAAAVNHGRHFQIAVHREVNGSSAGEQII